VKQYDIEQKAVNSQAVYWSCGPDVTVIEVNSSAGHRFTCLTDRTKDCKHCEAVRQYLDKPYV
jgi:hypothetical protein